MDVQMPEMDGLEAAKAIRQRERETGGHIPIIAMTAHTMTGDRENCLEAGMDRYISKPINTRELFETLENLIPGSPEETCSTAAPDESAEKDEFGGFDIDAVLERFDGDQQLLGQIAGLFLDDISTMMSDIGKAIENRDNEALERAAHTIKGAVGNFSARDAYEAVYRLEAMGRSGDLNGADNTFGGLENEIAKLITALKFIVKGNVRESIDS